MNPPARPLSQNPSMVGAGRDLCESPSPTPCPSRVTQSRLQRTLSRRVWNISREGDSTTSLGSLGQGSVTLRGKKFFLMFSWSLPSSASVCARCPLSCHWAPLERVWPPPLRWVCFSTRLKPGCKTAIPPGAACEHRPHRCTPGVPPALPRLRPVLGTASQPTRGPQLGLELRFHDAVPL